MTAEKHQSVNQSPCVHISGRWEASSTHCRPPYWSLRGWTSPKVLNWKEKEQIRNKAGLTNFIYITEMLVSDYCFKTEVQMTMDKFFFSCNWGHLATPDLLWLHWKKPRLILGWLKLINALQHLTAFYRWVTVSPLECFSKLVLNKMLLKKRL